MTGSLHPPHRHPADECALAPSSPQTALGNGRFSRWVPLWGEQRHWQKANAVVCQVLCAHLHCSPCVWLSTRCGHNVLTNPQSTWAGMGCVFTEPFSEEWLAGCSLGNAAAPVISISLLNYIAYLTTLLLTIA